MNEEFHEQKGFKNRQITDYSEKFYGNTKDRASQRAKTQVGPRTRIRWNITNQAAIRNDTPLNNAYYGGNLQPFQQFFGRTATYSGVTGLWYKKLLAEDYNLMPDNLTLRESTPPVVRQGW